MNKFVFASFIAFCAAPLFATATTYYAGVEDWNGLDYDYNDVVLSLSGAGLNLHSSASYFGEPLLGASGSAFWNHASLDGPNYNVGYCIYGGGSCNGGAALDVAAKYLAASQTAAGSANDVTFTATGAVQLQVILHNTDATDVIGWYALSDPGKINWLDPNGSLGNFSFSPAGAFGLVARSQGADPTTGYTYYSQDQFGSTDSVDHFAFFSDANATVTPEPGTVGSLLLGLLTLASLTLGRSIFRVSSPAKSL